MDGDQGPGTGAVGGRGPVRVGPGDVGARVVVRHLLPGGSASDALGELLAWGPDAVRVRRAGGEVIEVAPADVVAARVVPPATPRRAPRPPDGDPADRDAADGDPAVRTAPDPG